MSQRSSITKWFWCLFAVYVGPGWARAVSVNTPPKNPTTIEAQAKFFQDFFSVQLSPYKIEFGHVCEDPNTWEQRYEKKDFKNHRDMGKVTRHPITWGDEFNGYRHLPTHEDFDQGHRQGSERHFTERHERSRPSDGLFSAKVRWGDKQGGYGEHYWDLNHAGHAGNHGNDEYDSGSDDGSYNHDLDHVHDEEPYDEPSEQIPTYDTEEYDPEQAAKYDENGRTKRRAYPRIKTDRKLLREEETYEEPQKLEKTHRIKERLQPAPTQEVDKKEDKENNEPPKLRRRQRKPENVQESVEKQPDKEEQEDEQEPEQEQQQYHQPEQQQQPPQQYQEHQQQPQQHQQQHQEHRQQPQQHHQQQKLQQQHHHQQEQQQQQKQQQQQQWPQHYVNRAEKQFVPYEQGAGVRQHYPPEIIPAASSVPRLFLEPTTGHVVDRATGQAYVLQPIAINNYN